PKPCAWGVCPGHVWPSPSLHRASHAYAPRASGANDSPSAGAGVMMAPPIANLSVSGFHCMRLNANVRDTSVVSTRIGVGDCHAGTFVSLGESVSVTPSSLTYPRSTHGDATGAVASTGAAVPGGAAATTSPAAT